VNVAGIELTELHGPVAAEADGGRLTISAGPHTDLFVPPGGAAPVLTAPALMGETAGDFTLAASVSVDLAATFDAGALLLWSDATAWAKLALERSPEGRPTVVSVVTRGRSDDCNSVGLPDGSARLRVARLGEACAFHLRVGERWELVRHFTLGPVKLAAGFLAQSPTGDGCAAEFDLIELQARRLDDVRSGA
jgi:regulation of enolase protein 1 (concanavalin A-like superfamily)